MFNTLGGASHAYAGFSSDNTGFDLDLSTGGGYLATQAESGDSRNDVQRGNNGQPIHPLTISMVQRSCQQFPEEQRVKVLGEEVHLFKLVGMVRDLHVDEISEKWSFRLDDGSGSIFVEWLSNLDREYTEIGTSPWRREQLGRIQNFTYVRVFGDINTLGKVEPQITAFTVCSLDLPFEVFYHQSEVAKFIASKKFPEPVVDSNTSGVPSSFENIRPDGMSRPDGMRNETPNRQSFSNYYQPQAASNGPPAFSSTGGISFGNGNRSTDMRGGSAGGSAPLSFGSVDNTNNNSYNNTSHNAPVSFYGKQQQSELSQTILQILQSSQKPQGLSENDIVNLLWGKGMGLPVHDVLRECHTLLSMGFVSNNDGKWKVNNARF